MPPSLIVQFVQLHLQHSLQLQHELFQGFHCRFDLGRCIAPGAGLFDETSHCEASALACTMRAAPLILWACSVMSWAEACAAISVSIS